MSPSLDLGGTSADCLAPGLIGYHSHSCSASRRPWNSLRGDCRGQLSPCYGVDISKYMKRATALTASMGGYKQSRMGRYGWGGTSRMFCSRNPMIPSRRRRPSVERLRYVQSDRVSTHLAYTSSTRTCHISSQTRWRCSLQTRWFRACDRVLCARRSGIFLLSDCKSVAHHHDSLY